VAVGRTAPRDDRCAPGDVEDTLHRPEHDGDVLGGELVAHQSVALRLGQQRALQLTGTGDHRRGARHVPHPSDQPAVPGQQFTDLPQVEHQPGTAGGVEVALGDAHHVLEQPPGQLVDQRRLVLEPAVHGAQPDLRAAGDLLDAGLPPVLGEHRRGRLEHPLQVRLRVAAQRLPAGWARFARSGVT
jgi:hypothetical protein